MFLLKINQLISYIKGDVSERCDNSVSNFNLKEENMNKKEFIEALKIGKTLVNKTTGDTFDLDKAFSDGIIFTDHCKYEIYTPPQQIVTITKDKLINEYEHHVLGSGAGRAMRVEGFVHFLKALGFED